MPPQAIPELLLEGHAPPAPRPPGSVLASLSDDALLAEFKAGRDEAFDILYVRYRTRLLRYLRGMLTDPVLAEEVYNTTMYRVYSSLPGLNNPGHFRRYLYKTAHNVCLNTIRHESRLNRSAARGATHQEESGRHRYDVSPEDRVGDRQLLTLVREFLESMAPERRAALLLHHDEGLSTQEIASVLDRPVGTVRWLVHEARAMLASHLRNHLDY